ncbi:hypothetical protein RchiOBHm_Chr6g0310711 [Rosa chinensis]|uniref:Uncharacterized protein n=1 Tax=Rosa chinensis TaxID=74649 RepID=A0A2P6Q174_ROSCH|nr:hypothetical protein RchiOBHm_Chr6g0310711 [Rosa chinensis]
MEREGEKSGQIDSTPLPSFFFFFFFSPPFSFCFLQPEPISGEITTTDRITGYLRSLSSSSCI